MLPAGTSLGSYEIRSLLGAGGMGEVYLGWDSRLRRYVAVKVLFADTTSDPDRLRRFEREARAAGGLNHPNVVAIYDVGMHGSVPFVVSERLEGDTLRSRISAGDLTPGRAIDTAIQVARGLAAAHERGIVHRDLKPENVFLCTNGTAKVLDFGIAKLLQEHGDDDQTISQLTEVGAAVGTAPYMSPEQVRGEAMDARSDVFSLGTVLFEMLAGRRPFAGATRAETLTAILREDPAPLQIKSGVTPAMARIVARCLEKRPQDRFGSAKDVAFALEAVSAPGESFLPVAATARAGRARIAATAAAAMAAGVLLAAVVLDHVRPPAPPPSYTQLTFRRGTIVAARFAPDGESVVYSAAWDGGPARIFTTRVGGRESRDLGIDGSVFAVASTGELALNLGVFRRPGADGTLARVSLSGGAPRELQPGVLSADWDADGRDLALLRTDGEGTLLEYPIGNTLSRFSGPVGSLCVLPDGRVAVSARLSDGGDRSYAVSIIDRMGSRQVLSAGWAEPSQLAWSSSTNEIFFGGTTGGQIDLHAVSLAGRTRLVDRVPGDFQLQDVDRRGRVLMSRSFPRGGVLALAPGETQERDVSWLDFSFAIDLSADGQDVLVSELGDGLTGSAGMALRRTDGAPAVALGEGVPLALSADARYVLATSNQSDRLLVIPAAAGDRRKLEHPSLRHFLEGAWFPGGHRIAVVAGPDPTHTGLYVWDLDPAAAPQLVSQGQFGKPVVAPDGNWVTASRNGAVLARYPVTGGMPHVIPGTTADDEPLQWSSDGAWLFVRRGGGVPSYIERLEIATGRRVPWKELRPPERAGVFGISSVVVTPDGRGYAYTFASSLGTLYLAEGLK